MSLPINARHRIMVMAGKGGVGKTTVAVNLSLGLALYGFSVGLLDADITGPNVPKMLKMDEECFTRDEDGRVKAALLPVGPAGIQVASMAFILNEATPAAWKGPVKMAMLRRFLEDVDWEDMDYLIVDLPPGTSDEPLSIAQALHPDGVVIVTTPSELSLMDTRRAVDMARTLSVPVLGVVENMSGILCPACGKTIEFFLPGSGEKVANSLGVPFLGRIELDLEIARAGDQGRPFILDPERPSARSFESITQKIVEKMETGSRPSDLQEPR